MAQHIRVLSESDQIASLEELRKVLPDGFGVVVEDGDEQNWRQLLLRHREGAEVALIERDLVQPGEPGELEIGELMQEIEDARSQRTVEWLKHYLSHVKTVYSMQPLSGAAMNEGWSALYRAQAYFWKKFGGILQADNEGFTNREGQHVLWQFHGPQMGEIEAAVMNDAGEWTSFTMDMGDPEQVGAFRRGKVPRGAKQDA